MMIRRTSPAWLTRKSLARPATPVGLSIVRCRQIGHLTLYFPPRCLQRASKHCSQYVCPQASSLGCSNSPQQIIQVKRSSTRPKLSFTIFSQWLTKEGVTRWGGGVKQWYSSQGASEGSTTCHCSSWSGCEDTDAVLPIPWRRQKRINTILKTYDNDVIMSVKAFQITSLTIVYSAVYSAADQRKYHRWIPRTKGQ